MKGQVNPCRKHIIINLKVELYRKDMMLNKKTYFKVSKKITGERESRGSKNDIFNEQQHIAVKKIQLTVLKTNRFSTCVHL